VLVRRSAVIAVTSLLALSLPVASASAATSGGYVEVPNSTYVLKADDTDLGVFPEDPVRFELALRLRNVEKAKALAYAVSDPRSDHYGEFISPEDFRDAFAPTDQSSRIIVKWLRKAGMAITYNPANHLLIAAQGNVAAADKAFKTELHRIQDKDGVVFSAPLKPLFVPTNVDPIATGFVEGINKATRLLRPMHVDPSDDATPKHDPPTDSHPPAEMTPPVGAPPPDAFVNAPPCSAYWGEKSATADIPAVPDDFAPVPYAPCGYVADQMQGAYGVTDLIKNGIDGTGVTVAVVDAYNSPLIEQDSNAYFARHGLPPWGPTQFKQVFPTGVRLGYNDTSTAGNLCDEQGWYGEETLDVEAVHSLAPGANITYFGAASCLDSDLLGVLNDIVDNRQADIVTNSWGDSKDFTDPVLRDAYEAVFLESALVGVGMFFSSGDNGDEVVNSEVRTVDAPASSPWVTAVGGTSIGIGQDNEYLFETGWSTGKSTLVDGAWDVAPPGAYLYGAGGGTSQVFAQPKYQQGVVPADIADYFKTGKPGRAVPDISALGDPQTGMLIGITQTWPDGDVRFGEYRIGGTSLSSPVMAGIQALSDQAAGHPHGFANPAIYQLKAKALRDVVDPPQVLSVARVNFNNSVDDSDGLTTSLRSFNFGQTIATRSGYDDITGVGSPKGKGYVYGLGNHRDE
jgi:subtilase family serine protease